MDYSKRNYVQEREDVKCVIGELGFLTDWVLHHPQQAGQLAIEAHDLARRYVEEPTPDVEFRSVIPIAVWNQFMLACSVAEGMNLNEQSCYEKLEDVLFRGISSLIEQYMHE
jgi:hypothetical protein